MTLSRDEVAEIREAKTGRRAEDIVRGVVTAPELRAESAASLTKAAAKKKSSRTSTAEKARIAEAKKLGLTMAGFRDLSPTEQKEALRIAKESGPVTGQLKTVKVTELSGAKTFALEQVTDILQVTDAATQEVKEAAKSGNKVGEVIASPLSASGSEKPDTFTGRLKEGFISGVLGPLGHPYEDALGRRHDSRGRALGADIALAGAFVGGLVGGLTSEVGAGIAETTFNVEPVKEFIAEKKVAVADRRAMTALDQERLEIKEAKTGRAQDSVGRALLVPGDIARKVRARTPKSKGEGGGEESPAEATEAGVGGQLLYPGLPVEGGLRDEKEADAAEDPAEHTVSTRAGALMASASGALGAGAAAVKAKAAKAKKKLTGRGETGLPAMPAIPEAAPLTDKVVPSMATPLSAFDRIQAVAEGAKDKLSAALDGLPEPATGALDAGDVAKAGAVAVAVGAVATGGVLLAHEVAQRRTTSTPTRKRSSSKKASAKKRAPKKAAKKSGRKNVREDRRGVTRNTYRGQKVYTHKGRHYVIRKRKEGNMPAGTWKFINS